MVYVPGGGFISGSAGQIAGKIPGKSKGLSFDGSLLASHGLVVVVIQYRLGIFGFLQQPDGRGGANGLGDQITALQWVNQHISAFGGNPNEVTIFGESAGGTSVCLLSHFPKASGLFQRAIPESGVCYNSGDVLMNATEAKQARELFLSRTKITPQQLLTMDASELRNLTMRSFDPHGMFTPMFLSGVGQPSIDGDIYPNEIAKLTPLPVDMLEGFNSAEYPDVPRPKNGALAFFTKYLGGAAQDILAQYGENPNLDDVIMDGCLRCQSARFAKRVAARPGSQVYMYIFDNPKGICGHGFELPAVFGNAPEVMLEGRILKTSEALVRRTQHIWTEFAKGHHLREVVPSWPQIQTDSSVYAMLMGEEMNVLEITTAQCAAWIAAEAAVGGFTTAKMCNEIYDSG